VTLVAPRITGNPRQLLRRMRDVMAARGTVAHRLNLIVKLIAIELHADICSLYLLKSNQILELYAIQGEDIEHAQLKKIVVGQGLIGSIASSALPIALNNAQPYHFMNRHEHSEKQNNFQSFMGVPILRDGEVIGVITAQSNINRTYLEDEIETLEIIATVFAELIAGGQLVNLSTPETVMLPARLEGKRIISGIAIGQALLHQPRIDLKRLLADNPDTELLRLDKALEDINKAIQIYVKRDNIQFKSDYEEVLENYRSIFNDYRWVTKIKEAIYEGLTAEAAVYKVRSDTQARFKQIQDPIFREKLSEFEDLNNRLYYHLTGQENLGKRKIPPDAILFARNMASAELLDYDRDSLKGLVLEEATIHSHVAIVARSLDLPFVSHVEQILNNVYDNDPVILDAEQGIIYIRPQEDILESYQDRLNFLKENLNYYFKGLDLPSVTQDGCKISLKINAGFQSDLKNLKEYGVEGVGLYRSEIPFMVKSKFPNVDEQIETYQSIYNIIGDLPINFRTIDIGGDKILPYLKLHGGEENPAMGWRSLRITLDRPFILRQQIRALLEASQHKQLNIMFPMVTEVAEFLKAKEILDLEINRQKEKNKALPSIIKIGAMIEVPSIIWQLDQLLPHLSFVSLGTNDLSQFFFASDRNNTYVGERYDVLSSSFLRCLQHVAQICKKENVDLSVCGEMAGRPLDALALIGLGIQELSVSSSKIPALKKMIPTISCDMVKPYLEILMNAHDHSIREKLRQFAQDHDIIVH
jgi:phosphotransferase system, enzyme I, PtsP